MTMEWGAGSEAWLQGVPDVLGVLSVEAVFTCHTELIIDHGSKRRVIRRGLETDGGSCATASSQSCAPPPPHRVAWVAQQSQINSSLAKVGSGLRWKPGSEGRGITE